MKHILYRLFLVFVLLASSLTAFAQTTEKCANEFLRVQGLDTLTDSDPALFKDIFENDMYLGDLKSFVPVASPYLSNPYNLAPFIEQIKKGIVTKHPAIGAFLCEALKKNLFTGASAYHARVKRLVHQTFLLNLIVEKMLADLTFMNEVHTYFDEKAKSLGLPESFLAQAKTIYKATHSPFETAKMLTVDVSINQYIDYRTRIQLNSNDLTAKIRGLKTNILEATTADLSRGYLDNVKTGFILASSPVRKLWVEGPNLDVKQHFVDGWAELYQTWNLAFMTGNLKELDMMYPKLLIPVLVNAEPDDYLYRRGVALWVTASMILLQKLQHTERPDFGPFPEAARLWGSINLKYAREMANTIASLPDKSLTEKFLTGLEWVRNLISPQPKPEAHGDL